MQITNSKKIKDIQQEFSEKFPYLRLEFYKGKHESGVPSPVSRQLDPEKTIGKVRAAQDGGEGELLINERMKVSTLESRFWKEYGLNAQVFRLSGNLWLQTSTTDQWTLAEQNRKGESSEKAYKEMHGD